MANSAPAPRKSWLWVVVLVMMILPGIVSLLYLRSAPRKPLDSIAVLPFVNPSGDSETEQFAEQITASLILRLSQLPRLKVASLEATIPYRNETRTAQVVGHELGVRAVVRGRIEHRNGEILVSAELIDSGDSGVLWSRQYQLAEEDLAAFQDEIADDIADYLHS